MTPARTIPTQLGTQPQNPCQKYTRKINNEATYQWSVWLQLFENVKAMDHIFGRTEINCFESGGQTAALDLLSSESIINRKQDNVVNEELFVERFKEFQIDFVTCKVTSVFILNLKISEGLFQCTHALDFQLVNSLLAQVDFISNKKRSAYQQTIDEFQ